jgi:hypothetical protein
MVLILLAPLRRTVKKSIYKQNFSKKLKICSKFKKRSFLQTTILSYEYLRFDSVPDSLLKISKFLLLGSQVDSARCDGGQSGWQDFAGNQVSPIISSQKNFFI